MLPLEVIYMLTGLFSAALADPGLARARDLARSGAAQVDGARPHRAGRAAPVRGRRGRRRPAATGGGAGAPGARGHRHQPGGRRPGRRAGLPAAARAGGGLPGLGDAAARAAVARARTPSAAGWPCCAGWPTRTADAHGAPARCGSSSRRSARVLQPQLKGLGDLEPVRAAPPATRPTSRRSPARLADIAYARVDLVTKRGEFAVRGGILDVFPPTDEHPSRVEFWGDEVEEIRTFAVADQRTLEQVDAAVGAAVPGAAAHPGRCASGPPRWPSEHPELAEILDKLAEGIPVEGMESLAPALLGADSLELLLDCMPAGTHVLLCDPERIRTRAHDLVRTSRGVPAGAAGPRPPSAARPRSTSAPPPSGPWPRYARHAGDAAASPGGRCRPFGLAEADAGRRRRSRGRTRRRRSTSPPTTRSR